MFPLGVVNQQTLGGLWTPESLTGLEMWLEVGDIADFYQDDTKITAVTGDGDPVGSWVDKSGNGNDFDVSTAGYRPTYHDYGIESDSTDDRLISPNWLPPDEWIIGINFTKGEIAASQGHLSHSATATSAIPFILINGNAGGSLIQVYIDNGYRFTYAVDLDERVSIVIRCTKPASNYLIDVWFDGVKQTQYDASTSLNNHLTNPFYLFSGYNGYSLMEAHGFILAEGEFADSDAEDITDYLDGL